MSTSDFIGLVSNLKTLILEGKLDANLHLEAENLIYDHLTKATSKINENKSADIGADTHS